MPILRNIKFYPLVILIVFCLAVLYLGPLRPDYTLQAQWTGYIGAGLLVGAWCLARLVKRQPIATPAASHALLGLMAAFLLATAFSLDPRRSANIRAQIVFFRAGI